ncbi:MAG: virulence factor SrfC family protein [Methylobacter sp.]|nr:virulence factor SrfC family protein [Methylobacter sp.]
MLTAEQLIKRANQISSSCKDALSWCTNSLDEAIRNDKSLIKELRISIVSAERLALAAKSKMAVGVFGPSQAGKSYLISALARSSNGSLMSCMGDRNEDFIAKINPEGGKESTGLVTRFVFGGTLNITPHGMPIQVGLLTEIDIVKILANSFVEDVIHPTDDDLTKHQAAIETLIEQTKINSGISGNLQVEDIYDLENYCQQNLMKNPRVNALKRYGFWQAAIDMVSFMSAETRVKFFSAIWEELPTYTEIYRRLQNQLIRLNYAKKIYCEPSALFEVHGENWTRQKKSIIDVATLGNMCVDIGDTVYVAELNGNPIQIERAELTALVSELIIQLKEIPYHFFENTDLLDFPGARSRQPHPRDLLSSKEVRSDNFLRGKVAYLFERYSAERELSAMLLCVGPSNQEVVGLGELIERWVEVTHGGTPEERKNVPCTLLFILTKFDTAFEQGAGKSVDGTRWSTRLEASLLKPFGAHSHKTKWVSDWNGQGKFSNIFWLRNPNLRYDALFDFESPSSFVEKNIRQDKLEFVRNLRTAFLENQIIIDHFSDPVLAWDSAWILNDGGITRIVKGLEPICRPEVKLNQVEQQIDLLARRVTSLLARHYISTDVNELRSEKKKVATEIVKALGLAIKKRRLGEFISTLKLADDSACNAYFQTEREVTLSDRRQSKIATNEEPEEEMDEAIAALLGLVPEQKPKSNASKNNSGSNQDFASVFASNVIQTWMTTILEQSKDVSTTSYYGISSQLVLQIIRELEIALHKSGLYAHIIDEVRKRRAFKPDRKSVWMWKQVSPVTGHFNNFIDHAGNIANVKAGLPILALDEKPTKIFVSEHESRPLDRLSENSKNFEQKYLLDWINGLQYSVRTNADFLSGISGDIESNSRLGKILNDLRPDQV